MQRNDPNITTQYFGYNGLFNFTRALYISTYSLYLVDILRLPLSIVPLILVVNLLVTMVCEVPTGAYADLRGRKRSFFLAIAFSGIGYFIYSTAAGFQFPILFTFATACFAEIFLAAGYTFYSGALDSWVIDGKGYRKSHQLQWVLARGQGWKNLFYTVGGIFGIAVYFAGNKPISTFGLACMVCILLLLHVSVVMVPDEQMGQGDKGEELDWQSNIRSDFGRQIREGGDVIRANKSVLLLIACSSVAFCVVQLVVFFWPYYLIHEVHIQFESDRVLYQALILGFAWFIAYVARGIGNIIASKKVMIDMPVRGTGIALATNSMPIIVLAMVPFLSKAGLSPEVVTTICVISYAVVRLGEGMGDTLRPVFLNRLIDSSIRATILSISSSVSMIVSALGLIAVSLALHLGVKLGLLWAMAAILQLATICLYSRVLR